MNKKIICNRCMLCKGVVNHDTLFSVFQICFLHYVLFVHLVYCVCSATGTLAKNAVISGVINVLRITVKAIWHMEELT